MNARAVTSLANPTVKAVRALHLKKARDESGLFLAEGLKIVTEAVDLGFAPRILLHARDAADHPLLARAVAATQAAGGEVLDVTPEILAKVARRDNPQAVVGVFRQKYAALSSLTPGISDCWIALHRVRDPGNLGTILRTLDAAGGGGLILVGECCDPYSVEAVRATMGSIFAVKIAHADEAAFAAWRKTWPGSVIGTLLTAQTPHHAARYRAPSLILMGNEQQGLPTEMAALCDVQVKIPMRGRADSLNLAVASGIMIYAATEHAVRNAPT